MLYLDDTVQNNVKHDIEYKQLVQGIIISVNKMMGKMDISMCKLFELNDGKTRYIVLDVYFDNDTVNTNLQYVERLQELVDVEICNNKYAQFFTINMKYEKHD